MAIAHGGFVWDYVVCDPDPEECRKYAFARDSAPDSVEGYVATDAFGVGNPGFVSYDNKDEIWMLGPLQLVPEEEELPAEVADYLF